MTNVAVALTIAGSDSGGGAGIQADLKTFAFHCVHGTSAITCITAQNTLGVKQVQGMSPALVMAQITAVMEDIGTSSVKTGMLLNREIIEAVVQQVDQWGLTELVVDPVMVSRSGVQLIDEAAITALRDDLIPRARIVTPNRFEAQLLSGREINSLEQMQQAAKIIHSQGAKVVLLKGGGMSGDNRGVDVWFDGKNWELLRGEYVDTHNTHGTGCTLSAGIAANLAKGLDLLSAVKAAKTYVTTALKSALNIGNGSGPVAHFFPLQLHDNFHQ
ncbi:bifunctional hydroxymethylpyrimidine kinase/phosphomethylpyrimidine kinase [Gloeothece verrucosa]|uniref:Phosphomethylpyrimidine kinase n=1 Tax=Gloeothece verrucosa (strain PCC 7822) TaxID=497965 RepID=E0UF39_GLOV7|nr:bifunctional hydroxymethylpyrimidine kinase/phosphomethylpyrimidine kinase [Gloeothece verrucosa]ADN14291.1 phosphomethylpyrimidine kinase [Gloeothece verrucosa PCC 7822]